MIGYSKSTTTLSRLSDILHIDAKVKIQSHCPTQNMYRRNPPYLYKYSHYSCLTFLCMSNHNPIFALNISLSFSKDYPLQPLSIFKFYSR